MTYGNSYTKGYKKKLFLPDAKDPFKLSRSKIDLFVDCPRCFYLDRRLGVSRPQGFPFNLNSAVDLLLKKEFDTHRVGKTPHPLMIENSIDAIPFAHKDIDVWRENFIGVQTKHEDTNLIVFGAVDDVWINKKEELIVVDYKATSKDSEVNLDAEWQDGYKRQMEVYQWLLRQNGFKVSPIGYFVYANGKRDRDSFNARLDFDIKVIPYTGDDSWIPRTLGLIKQCLMDDRVPMESEDCEYCSYRKAAGNALLEALKKPEIEKPKKIAARKKNVKADDAPTLF